MQISETFAKFAKNVKMFAKFSNFLTEICKICSREDDFLVDFEKCFKKMRIWTRKSASIQPRTSLRKSAVSWPKRSLLLRVAQAHERREPPAARAAEVPERLSEARSRLDRSRFSRPNTHFAAFFKIYKKITFSRANFANFC